MAFALKTFSFFYFYFFWRTHQNLEKIVAMCPEDFFLNLFIYFLEHF